MTDRQIIRQSKQLLTHVLDSRGFPEAKLVRAVSRAVASSRWPHRAALLRAFSDQVRQLESRLTATITTASSLSSAQQQQIMELIGQQHPHIVAYQWQVDKDLLGGMTVLAGDSWFDVSVKQRLAQVQETLG